MTEARKQKLIMQEHQWDLFHQAEARYREELKAKGKSPWYLYVRQQQIEASRDGIDKDFTLEVLDGILEHIV